MTLLPRTLTIAALAAVLVLPAGAAPSAPSARVTYGKPTVSWTIPPGSTADTIQFARSLPAELNAFWRNASRARPASRSGRHARGSCLRVLRRRAARPLRRRPRYSLRGAVRPVQGRGHEHPCRLEGSRTASGGQGRALPDLENAVALRVQANAPSILLPRLARQGRRDDVFRDQVRTHLEREARPGRLREVRPVLRPSPVAESRRL
jgi:hypothetical protein